MKKTWIDPRIEVQQFVPDEYVAVCWEIACDYGVMGGNIGVSGGRGETSTSVHTKRNDGTGCGYSTNQYITQNADGSYSIVEINVQGQPNLNALLTASDNYTNLSTSISNISNGQTIYWVTENSSGTTWYHRGTVNVSSGSSVNRS